MTNPTIGFIGLGHMGHPMVINLLKSGLSVYIYDTLASAMDSLEQHGAHKANSIKNISEQADVIFLSVQTSEQVKDICRAPDGIFKHAKQNLLLIDCSSIDIRISRELHAEAAQLRIAMLDAPVSGGVAGAKAATLTFMVGGSEIDFKRAYPLLEKMGQKILHAGGPGAGQAAKICNNLLLAISMIGVSEAFVLAEKLGLEAKKFFEISSNSSGQCWAMTRYCPAPNVIENVPANNHYQPGFMSKMMLKDLRLAQHAAESVNAAIPLGGLATELYELYVNQGNAEIDFSGIINFIATKNEAIS